MPYMMGKKMIAPEPNTNPNGRPPVPAPFTREKHAMIAPTINPRIAYVTRPTMNADLGPMRLTVAIVFLLPNLARMVAEGDNVTKGYLHWGILSTSQTTAPKTVLFGGAKVAQSAATVQGLTRAVPIAYLADATTTQFQSVSRVSV